jgi:hypothetical protein
VAGDPFPETPEGWTDPRRGAGCAVVVLMLFGLLMVGVGVVSVVDGDRSGIVMLPFGLTLPMTIPLFRPRRHAAPTAGPVEGSAEPGLIFGFSLARMVAVAAGSGLFAVALFAMAVWADSYGRSQSVLRVLGVLGGGFFAFVFLARLRARRGGYVAATRRGVRVRSGGFRAFVPWETLVDVRATQLRRRDAVEPYIGLFVGDRDRIERSGGSGFPSSAVPRSLGDVTLPARPLETEPVLVLATLRHYWRNPSKRRDLGAPESVVTFERLAAAFSEKSGPRVS